MDLLTTYRRSVEAWVLTVSKADAWGKPTPCTGWNVRELINHVVGEDRWTAPLVQGQTIADVGDALEGDLLGDDPKEAARTAAAEAVDTVARKLPDGGSVHLSYGEEDIGEYVRQLVADHLVHGWDLAAATGHDRILDPDVVAETAAWYRDREEMYRSAGAVAARPKSATSRNAQAELLIAFGRDPDWNPPSASAVSGQSS